MSRDLVNCAPLEIERLLGDAIARELAERPNEERPDHLAWVIDRDRNGGFPLALSAAQEFGLPLDVAVALARGFVERCAAARDAIFPDGRRVRGPHEQALEHAKEAADEPR